MYQTGMISRILVPMFYVPVLLGGVAILVLAVIRAVAVGQLAGARRVERTADDADHIPSHSHSHGHDHGHSHSHSHGDDHGPDCGLDHAHSHAGGDDHGHEH